MQRIINNTCGTNFIVHNGKLLGSINIIVNHSEDKNEYISIGEKEDVGDSYWYISLYNPEYKYIHGNKMTKEELDEFITIMNDNWDKIISCIDNECDSLCGEDKKICGHYKNRNIKNIPDYTLLIEESEA